MLLLRDATHKVWAPTRCQRHAAGWPTQLPNLLLRLRLGLRLGLHLWLGCLGGQVGG